jgi:hypothetical protein
MKILVRRLIAVVVAIAALAAQAADRAHCWEPTEDAIEGLVGEKNTWPTL